MGKVAELEYAKLLENNTISQELVEHPQFYTSFIRQYEGISLDEQYPVEVIVSDNEISLLRKGNYPDATNGIYLGVKDATQIKFKIDELHGKKYFRVERKYSSVHSFPNKGEQLGNSMEIEVYEENALLGRGHYSNFPKDYFHNLDPNLGFIAPNFPTGGIIQGMLPTMNERSIAGDYNCHVAGRVRYEEGLVEKNSISRRDGRYIGKSSTAAVNLENTMTIDNSADFVVYDKDMNITQLNSNFQSPTEAKEYFQARYEEAIKKGKSL